jgi:hypothetical protein
MGTREAGPSPFADAAQTRAAQRAPAAVHASIRSPRM